MNVKRNSNSSNTQINIRKKKFVAIIFCILHRFARNAQSAQRRKEEDAPPPPTPPPIVRLVGRAVRKLALALAT